MSYKVDCPNCQEELEIDHDLANGYGEDREFKYECPYCEHVLIYRMILRYECEVDDLQEARDD